MSTEDLNNTSIDDRIGLLRAACQPCASAKTKCSFQGLPVSSTTTKCERCIRLDKECVEQHIKPRPAKRGKYKKSKHDNVSIEQKVDRLFELLDQQKQTQADSSSTTARVATSSPNDIVTPQLNANESISTPSTYASHDHNSLYYSIPDSQRLLEVYYFQQAENFPFVLLPHGWTAQSLNQTHPLLLKVIVTISSYHDFARQGKLALDVLEDLTRRVYLNGEKNLQILQALLVFTAWYHPFMIANPQVTTLVHLICALTSDLGLDNHGPRFANADKWRTAMNKTMHGNSYSVQARTIEERRTVLGVFFLCSIMFTSLDTTEKIAANPYFDECCRVLERENYTSTDAQVCFLTRVQLIVVRANKTLTDDMEGTVPASPGVIVACLKVYQSELWSLYNDTADTIRENKYCQLHFHHARICIYKHLVDNLSRVPSPNSNNMKQNSATMSTEISMLSAIASSVESWCRILFSLPHSTYFAHPSSLNVQLIQVLLTLVRLKYLRYGDWSLETMNPGLDVLWMLDETIKAFDIANTAAQVNGFTVVGNDLYERFARRFRLFAAWQRGAASSIDFRPINVGRSSRGVAGLQTGVIQQQEQQRAQSTSATGNMGFDVVAGMDTNWPGAMDLDDMDSLFWQGLMNGMQEPYGAYNPGVMRLG